MIFFKKNTNYDSYADDELYYVKPTKKLVDNINLSFKDSDLKDDIDEFTKLVTNESKFDDYNKTDLKDTLINIMKRN